MTSATEFSQINGRNGADNRNSVGKNVKSSYINGVGLQKRTHTKIF